MGTWSLEPGHTAAEFCARHMMVTYVRGHFKNVRGTMEFDPAHPKSAHVSVEIDASMLWTGEPARDDHLRNADFLDVERHPHIRYESDRIEVIGDHDYVAHGRLSVRGITREVPLRVTYLGMWQTPWFENGVDKGPKTRAGFVAKTQINRHDFGVSWNAPLERGGLVVGNIVEITIDAEAVLV